MSTLSQFLTARAARIPDAPALLYRDQVMSYDEFEDATRRCAGGLRALGIGPGDRVAIWLPNVPAWPILFFACAQLGAIAVAVNTRFRSAEVADILDRSGAKLLVLWPDFKGIDFAGILNAVDPAALEKLATIVVYQEDDVARFSNIIDKTTVAIDDLAGAAPIKDDEASTDAGCVMFTTSGTTKAPKFVLHTHGSIVRHANHVVAPYQYDRPDARVLQVIPFCGVFGFNQALGAVAGGALIACETDFDAERMAAQIHELSITHLHGSDDMFARLLDAAPNDVAFPSLGFCGYGAFTPELGDIVARADARGLTLTGLYGSSEIQALFASRAPDAPVAERVKAGGTPVASDAHVRARDPDTGKLLAQGEIGELEFTGPSQMREYFEDPDATAAAMTDDGYVRSGDLGRIEAGGGFEFLSRMGDVLRLGGFLVNPQEIEAYLQTHPSVAGCQVIGIDGPRGLQPVAFVIPASGHPFVEETLHAHAANGMAKFKVPTRILPIDEFPTTTGPNGSKIQKAKLRELALAAI